MDKHEQIMDLQEQLTDGEFLHLFVTIFGWEKLFEDFSDYIASIDDDENYDEIIEMINQLISERKTNENKSK